MEPPDERNFLIHCTVIISGYFLDPPFFVLQIRIFGTATNVISDKPKNFICDKQQWRQTSYAKNVLPVRRQSFEIKWYRYRVCFRCVFVKVLAISSVEPFP